MVCNWYQLDAKTNHQEPCRVEWNFTIEKIDVSSVSLQPTIWLEADKSEKITPGSQWMTITPSNATIETTNWTSTNTDVATISNSGFLVGKKPGTTTIYCIVNGSVRSNDAQVIVSEPSFTFKGFSIADQTNNVYTKPTITADYSLALTLSTNFDQIALTEEQGKKVAGTASINSSTISFTPTNHLQPLSTYTLTIPKGAVKNKWGTDYLFEQTVSFVTGDWKKMSLSVQPEAKYIMHGDQIVLSCSAPEATIYYSTDGSEPTTRYTKPLTFEQDMTLKAVARLDGYYDTEVLTKDYMQRIEIIEHFPDAEPLYVFANVNPCITFSQRFSGDLSGITLQCEDTQMGTLTFLDFEPILHDHTLYFVPKEPLVPGMNYVVSIPNGALTTEKGEQMAAIDWHFTTGSYAIAVSTGGPELMAALLKDGSLWTWGKRLTEANAENGSYNYTVQTEPGSFVGGDVVAVSSGFMHHAIIKRDGTLWMWGRQLCGEFGNGSTTASANPVKVMDGVKSVSCGLQTTAIVKKDSTLWMCGRNDFGQIDDSRTVKQQFVKVAEDIKDVTLGYGFIQVEKADGTSEKRTWDNEIDNQRKPTATGNGIPTELVAVEYGWKNAVALGKDGSVWTWGDSPENTTPTKVIEGRTSSELAGLSAANKTVNVGVQEKAVLTALPVPMNADYATLTWTSSNSTIAKVSNRGVVTGKQKGTTTVTAKISSASGRNYSQQFTVIVDGTPSRGDANRDGTVNMADIGTIINYLAGVTEGVAFDCVDVNGDGTVNVADIITVASIIAE